MSATNTDCPLVVRSLGRCEYIPVWEAMRNFTYQRNTVTPDELWLVEHLPVFTQGLAGKAEHILNARDIPIVQTDRGGQVTYHGPGQLVVYTLVDLVRRKLGLREFVQTLESALIQLLQVYGIESARLPGAPGVYVNGTKIAALGLRVKNGRSYHGLSLNVCMDLEPFSRINPCGYPGLAVTQLATHSRTADITIEGVGRQLVAALSERLNYKLGSVDVLDRNEGV